MRTRPPFSDYPTMAEQQARLDYALDQQRFAPYSLTTLAAAWTAHMVRDACCTPAHETHYTSTEPDAIVQLGSKTIADAQYAEDQANGGLVWLAMNRR